MRRILVPVDFSPGMQDVARFAAKLARAFSADLTLLHVAPPEPDFVSYEPGPDSVRTAVARELSALHHKLHELDRSLEAEGLSVTSLVIQGYTVEKILQEILRLGADLVVMGSHGHGALRHLLVGSVTEGVIRESPVPVVVVPTRPTSRS
ncbi:MAG: universal stress protein [Kiritimatiellae bacterium]|nr:universal stress protein [Kiritimatiellia bacterium]MDW8459072.1 universal stress protein [Verrucomicrobiota bacterium]